MFQWFTRMFQRNQWHTLSINTLSNTQHLNADQLNKLYSFVCIKHYIKQRKIKWIMTGNWLLKLQWTMQDSITMAHPHHAGTSVAAVISWLSCCWFSWSLDSGWFTWGIVFWAAAVSPSSSGTGSILGGQSMFTACRPKRKHRTWLVVVQKFKLSFDDSHSVIIVIHHFLLPSTVTCTFLGTILLSVFKQKLIHTVQYATTLLSP